MAAERPASLDTPANVLAILKGARDKIAQGFNLYYDALDGDSLPTSSVKTYTSAEPVSWSLTGALAAAGAALKLYPIVGCYCIYDKIDVELIKTLVKFGVVAEPGYLLQPKNQEEALLLLDTTIKRLSGSHS